MNDQSKRNNQSNQGNKKEYVKPSIESEEILEAGLMASCNGTSGGPDSFKVTKGGGCSTKKS